MSKNKALKKTLSEGRRPKISDEGHLEPSSKSKENQNG